jgi:ketosteroid isomerase-like protein
MPRCASNWRPAVALIKYGEGVMANDLHDFEQFMQRRAETASAYVRGDAAPLDRIVAREGTATFFGPGGGAVQGVDEVSSRYLRDARSFAPGGESRFEVLQMGASDGLAYWVGFQRATAYMQGQSEPVSFNLRVTEVFRREGNAWKMVHRHADPLATEASEQKT